MRQSCKLTFDRLTAALMRHDRWLRKLRRETALLAERAFGGQELATEGGVALRRRR